MQKISYVKKCFSNQRASYVQFISYFCRLVFGILVTLVAWFSFCFAHFAFQNVNKDYVIFLYFCNFVAKSDQKWKMGWTKHKWELKKALAPSCLPSNWRKSSQKGLLCPLKELALQFLQKLTNFQNYWWFCNTHLRYLVPNLDLLDLVVLVQL